MNNFTPRGQQALALARKEADRFNHNYVGTEHLLLALIKLGKGVAVNVLQKMGVNLETVSMEIEKQVGSGPETKVMGNIPYTPRVKKVLALAAKEARALNHSYVGTEHILLGIIREGDGVSAHILKNLNVDVERCRLEILRELDPNFQPPKDHPSPPNRLQPDDEWKKRFRHHPLVQNYLYLVTAVAERKETAIREQDFEEAATLRAKETELTEKLELVYKRLAEDPNYGVCEDQKLAQVCRAVEWVNFISTRPEQARAAATHLLLHKPVIILGREGASRLTMAGFIARDVFELTAQTNLIGTRLMRFDFSALDRLAKQEGYAVALLSVFDRIAQTGNHLLVVPHLDHFATTELCSEETLNAWSQLINSIRARRVPLLTWTDPDVGLPRLKSVWPGFVDMAAVIHLQEPSAVKLKALIEEQLTAVSAINQIEFEDGSVDLILTARTWWEQRCPLAEPGRTLKLVEEVLRRLAEDYARHCVSNAMDAVVAEITSLQKQAVDSISVADFVTAEEILQRIRLLKLRSVPAPPPTLKQSVTRPNVADVLKQIYECQS